jgi:hypothetical protein
MMQMLVQYDVAREPRVVVLESDVSSVVSQSQSPSRSQSPSPTTRLPTATVLGVAPEERLAIAGG